MSGQCIVVIEDEPAIANAVASRLRSEGFAVEVADDGPSGIRLCGRANPHLVVLDLMLPGLDGLEVCRRIQAQRPVPVLMLTARGAETDKVVGLAVGADDYLTKPFSPRELVARIRAILRRVELAAERGGSPEEDGAAALTVGDVVLEPASRRVRRAGEPVHLTPTEFDLCAFLASRPGVVFSRERLLAEVWGYADGAGPRTVDSHVRALRRKLGYLVVRTVHGVGYAVGEG